MTTRIQAVAKTKKKKKIRGPPTSKSYRNIEGSFTYHRGCDFELCYHNIKENGNLRSMEGVDIKAAEM